MANSKRYKIRFPDPDYKMTGRRYLFSMGLEASALHSLCPTPSEKLALQIIPSWSLYAIGTQLLGDEVLVQQVIPNAHENSSYYKKTINNLFDRHPTISISSGRPFQGNTDNIENSAEHNIASEIVSYWQQGVRFISSILHAYFTQLKKHERHIAISLQSLLAPLVHIKRNGSLYNLIEPNLIQPLLNHESSHTIAFHDGEWLAIKNSDKVVSYGSGAPSKKTKAIRQARMGDLSNFGTTPNIKKENISSSVSESDGITDGGAKPAQEVPEQKPSASSPAATEKPKAANTPEEKPVQPQKPVRSMDFSSLGKRIDKI